MARVRTTAIGKQKNTMVWSAEAPPIDEMSFEGFVLCLGL
jgi:hypothetical protein